MPQCKVCPWRTLAVWDGPTADRQYDIHLREHEVEQRADLIQQNNHLLIELHTLNSTLTYKLVDALNRLSGRL